LLQNLSNLVLTTLVDSACTTPSGSSPTKTCPDVIRTMTATLDGKMPANMAAVRRR